MTGAPSGSAELVVHGGLRAPGGARRLARELRHLARLAAARAGRPVALSFALVDDAAMRELHRETLGDDAPTDVLAFPFEEVPVLEGEVVLCLDTARREACARGHDARAELLLYAVHGVLHLLGEDDHDAAARRRMRRAERDLLEALGLPDVYGAGAS